MEQFIKIVSETDLGDIGQVGHKNAILGELSSKLRNGGIQVPHGFFITAGAFRRYISANELAGPLATLDKAVDRENFSNLSEVAAQARKLIMNGKFPRDLELPVIGTYYAIFQKNEQEVAVRSSIASEVSGIMNFQGQNDSYLNIRGEIALMYAVKRCFASLYNERAIKYRGDHSLPHDSAYLSVCIQQMVRADLACSGTGCTGLPQPGFGSVVYLAGTWGLGLATAGGRVTFDEYLVSNPNSSILKEAVLQKKLGSKNTMVVYSDIPAGTNSTYSTVTPRELRERFILEDTEAGQLAQLAQRIAAHCGQAMGFEWAKDGVNQQLYIVQATPLRTAIRPKLSL